MTGMDCIKNKKKIELGNVNNSVFPDEKIIKSFVEKNPQAGNKYRKTTAKKIMPTPASGT
jgi:hypothetical protein